MNRRLAEAIRAAQQDSTKKITEEEFRQFSRGVEFLGYTDAYIGVMRSARAYYEQFPYSGWTHPTDGVNAVMRLVHEKTWFLNKPTLTPEERAYFHAVAEEANQVVRRAYENNNGTGTAVRAGIGPDELPQTLDIEPMATWLAAHPNAGQPVIPPLSPTPPPAPGVAPTEAKVVWDTLNQLYIDHWDHKVYKEAGVVKDGVDDENVNALQGEIDFQKEEMFKKIVFEPTKKAEYIQAFTEYLDEQYKTAEAGWWEFWE
jgi:hypothetical protein